MLIYVDLQCICELNEKKIQKKERTPCCITLVEKNVCGMDRGCHLDGRAYKRNRLAMV